MAVLALAAGGAFIGGSIAGAIGAQIGWLIGSFIGQALFAPSQKFEGPRLRDLQVQSSTDGAPMPLTYGTTRLAGNIIWSTPIREKKTKKKVKSGKGIGGKSTQTTYTYSVSMAIGLCEGEITGIRRIWSDSKLLYSVADGASPATFNASTKRATIRIYLGSTTQTTDPLIASAVGAANAPGYRDTAYLVFENLQLADFANHIPNIEAEVVKAGAPVHPTFNETVPPGTATSAFVMKADALRSCVYYCLPIPTTGDKIYKWDCTSNAPTELATIRTSLFTGTVGITLTGEHQEIWVTGASSRGQLFEVFDAQTGALKSNGELNFRINPSPFASPIDVESPIHYDPILDGFWCVGRAFGDQQLHLCFAGRATGTRSWQFINVGAPLSDGQCNQQTMIDGDGVVWIVRDNRLIECKVPCNVYGQTGSPTGGFYNQPAFIWNARGEIWIPRVTGHPTSGWHVFNLASRTFSESLTLGSWTTTFVTGVVNTITGNAWFVRLDGATVDAQLRDADLNLVLTLNDIWTGGATGFDTLDWFPGVVLVNVEEEARCFYEYTLAQNGVALSTVVSNLCERGGAETPEVTDLTSQTVRGYIRARPMSTRSALEPLAMAFQFDARESDNVLEFVSRGGSSVATLEDDDLGAHQAGSNPPAPVETTRAQEEELPATLVVSFFNQGTDYDFGSATARRLISDAEQVAGIELPIVFTTTEGNQVADRLMQQAWLEREKVKVFLGPEHQLLEPADVITLPDARRVRLIRTNYRPPGILECEAVSDDQGAIISYAVGNTEEPDPVIDITIGTTSIALFMDIPLLLDHDDDASLYLAATGENAAWPGAVFYESPDDGTTWNAMTATDTPARIGVIVSGSMRHYASPDHWDHASEITVKLFHEDLTLTSPSSVEAFYAGETAIALGKEDAWEIAQYFTVVDNGNGTYTLRDFLRGRRGTEWAVSDHAEGTQFVVLEDPEVQNQTFSLARIGTLTLFKAVTSGGDLEFESADEEVFDGVAAKPYAPVKVNGALSAAGVFTISWVRRARRNAAWLSSVDVPLDEPAESYDVEIWDPAFSSLKRTFEGVLSPQSYTAAMGASDFGSPGPSSIGIRVYQLSDRVGRGYPGDGYGGIPPDPLEMNFSESLKTTNIELSEAGFTVTKTTASFEYAPVGRTRATGKFYWEVKLHSRSGATSDFFIGITERSTWSSGSLLTDPSEIGLKGNGTTFGGSSTIGIAVGDTVMVAWDATNGKLWFGRNGIWPGSVNPANGTGNQCSHTPSNNWRPLLASQNAGGTWVASARFRRGHDYEIPAGFVPMN